MDVYTLYIEDDRYSVPTIDILSAQSDDEARALVVERLAASPHYQSVEAWVDDRFVCRAPDDTPAAAPPAPPKLDPTP